MCPKFFKGGGEGSSEFWQISQVLLFGFNLSLCIDTIQPVTIHCHNTSSHYLHCQNTTCHCELSQYNMSLCTVTINMSLCSQSQYNLSLCALSQYNLSLFTVTIQSVTVHCYKTTCHCK